MSRYLYVLRRLLLITLFVVPTLACEFSASTAKITDGVMAEDVQGDNFEPIGITDAYSADQPTFHAVVSVANAPSDTAIKAVWIAVDVGDVAPPNTEIDQTVIQIEGSRNIDFTLTPDSAQWPPGTYKVDVYLDDKLERTLNFTVTGLP